MSDKWHKICLVCLFTGTVLPWGLLIFAALLGLVPGQEWAERMSAYSAALGLFIMALGFFFARFVRWINR